MKGRVSVSVAPNQTIPLFGAEEGSFQMPQEQKAPNILFIMADAKAASFTIDQAVAKMMPKD